MRFRKNIKLEKLIEVTTMEYPKLKILCFLLLIANLSFAADVTNYTHCYRLENNGSDVNGTNDLVVVSTVTYSSVVKAEGSYSGNFTAGYLTNGSNDGLSTGNHDRSICTWFWSFDGTYGYLGGAGTNSGSEMMYIVFNPDGTDTGSFAVYLNANDQTWTGLTFNQRTWYQACAVYHSSNHTGTLYVNGAIAGWKTFGGNANFVSGNIRVGTNHAGGTDRFSGMIDDFRIYDYALSDSQVSQIYSPTGAPTINQAAIFNNSAATGTTFLNGSQLYGFANVADNSAVNVSWRWYVNTTLNATGTLNAITNNTLINIANVTGASTFLGANWTLEVTAHGTGGNTTLNSSTVTIASPFNVSNCSVLSSPGTYTLYSDLTHTGAGDCMQIQSNNVTLDCNHHTIIGDNSFCGDGAGDYMCTAIRAWGNNTLIKNCNTTGFWVGIGLYSAADATIGGNNITITDTITGDTGSGGGAGLEVWNTTNIHMVNVSASSEQYDSLVFDFGVSNVLIENSTFNTPSECGFSTYGTIGHRSNNITMTNSNINGVLKSGFCGALGLHSIDNSTFINNTISGDMWLTNKLVSGTGSPTGIVFSDGTRGNRYVLPNGSDSSTAYNTTTTSPPGWATGGSALPFSATTVPTYFSGSQFSDSHPWTLNGASTNAAPSIAAISVVPATINTTTNASCNLTATDAESSLLNITGEWYKNGANQTGIAFIYSNLANNTPMLVSNITFGNYTSGDNISCRAKAFDGTDYSSWSMSANVTITGTGNTGNSTDFNCTLGTAYLELDKIYNFNTFYLGTSCTISTQNTTGSVLYINVTGNNYANLSGKFNVSNILAVGNYSGVSYSVAGSTFYNPSVPGNTLGFGRGGDGGNVSGYQNGTGGSGGFPNGTGGAGADCYDGSSNSIALNGNPGGLSAGGSGSCFKNSGASAGPVSGGGGNAYGNNASVVSTPHGTPSGAAAGGGGGAGGSAGKPGINIYVRAISIYYAGTFDTSGTDGSAGGNGSNGIIWTDQVNLWAQGGDGGGGGGGANAGNITLEYVLSFVNASGTPIMNKGLAGSVGNGGLGMCLIGQTNCYPGFGGTAGQDGYDGKLTVNQVSSLQLAYSMSSNNTTAAGHSFNISAGAMDSVGAGNIVTTNASSTIGSCAYLSNSTSGNYFNSTFNCTSTIDGCSSVSIGFTNSVGSYVGAAPISVCYPDKAPTIAVPAITPANANVTSLLNCSNGTFSDVDSDTENISARIWAWYKNGTLVSGQLQQLNLQSISVLKGDIFSCNETTQADNWTLTAANQSANLTINNSIPVPNSPAAISIGSTFIAVNCTTTDSDNGTDIISSNLTFAGGTVTALVNKTSSTTFWKSFNATGLSPSTAYSATCNFSDTSGGFANSTTSLSTTGGDGYSGETQVAAALANQNVNWQATYSTIIGAHVCNYTYLKSDVQPAFTYVLNSAGSQVSLTANNSSQASWDCINTSSPYTVYFSTSIVNQTSGVITIPGLGSNAVRHNVSLNQTLNIQFEFRTTIIASSTNRKLWKCTVTSFSDCLESNLALWVAQSYSESGSYVISQTYTLTSNETAFITTYDAASPPATLGGGGISGFWATAPAGNLPNVSAFSDIIKLFDGFLKGKTNGFNNIAIALLGIFLVLSQNSKRGSQFAQFLNLLLIFSAALISYYYWGFIFA